MNHLALLCCIAQHPDTPEAEREAYADLAILARKWRRLDTAARVLRDLQNSVGGGQVSPCRVVFGGPPGGGAGSEARSSTYNGPGADLLGAVVRGIAGARKD